MPRDHRSSTSNKTDAGSRSRRESSRSKPGSDKGGIYGTSKDAGGSRDRRRREEKRGDGVSKSTNNRTATLEGFVSEKKPSYGKKKEEQR